MLFNCGTVIAGSVASAFYSLFGCTEEAAAT